MLSISQGELAAMAGVGERTIAGFESGEKPDLRESTLWEIQAALEARGIEFTNGDGIGVRLSFAKAEAAARLGSAGR